MRLQSICFFLFAFAVFPLCAVSADFGNEMPEMMAMKDMSMQMLMLHGNIFGVHSWESGSRGRDAFASTSMVMVDAGKSASRHYFNVDLMLTAEKWTVPDRGYPLFLQIGEHDNHDVPFLDAQHPHSSPVMGLTFSDTISIGEEKDHLLLYFAPRGEVTDGPLAFMHRTTGMINPDAPLGHHVGQDVGHITSTVFGTSLQVGTNRFEASTYHGAEPEPEKVDLPLGTPDSFSVRWMREISSEWLAMISAARVNSPEPDSPDVKFENRFSGSAYWEHFLDNGWKFYLTSIYGLATQYDHANFLSSFTEEFLFKGETPRVWGRVEVLQRTPAELEISDSAPNRGQWVTEVTLGYTHRLKSWDELELGLGASITRDFLPDIFIDAYGGDPWTGKVFLQLGGMKMWE